ncbi:MAG: Fe-S protein assembly co-chaperone HscB [Granulosicoccus sp.]|nr:Fe-S protein assembly co-chaperone HscB [Granulosicoccus sp.]
MSLRKVRDRRVMQVDLSQNFFQLFALPQEFPVDEKRLVSRFQELQKQLHPDRFAAASSAERRWSMQAASVVNEAYQTLSRELPRAIYLLTLQGVSVDEETDTQMAPAFLMEQMEYREALEAAENSADPVAALERLRQQLKSGVVAQREAFTRAADESNWNEARTVVRQWQFLDKLSREVRRLDERLDT